MRSMRFWKRMGPTIGVWPYGCASTCSRRATRSIRRSVTGDSAVEMPRWMRCCASAVCSRRRPPTVDAVAAAGAAGTSEGDGLGLQLSRPQPRVEVREQDVAFPRHRVHHERRVRRIALRIVWLEDGDLAPLVRQVAEQLTGHVDDAHAAVVIRLIQHVVLDDDVV